MKSADIVIIAGSANGLLSAGITAHLGIHPCASTVRLFSEGNVFVRIDENVRGRDVYIVQSTAEPVNRNFMELMFFIDAARRASARSVTAIIPWFSYAKGDKRDNDERVSIRARVCADMMEAAGADRMLTVDLHAPQVQGFFRIPVEDLHAMGILCEALHARLDRDSVIVAPDAGSAKRARQFAERLKLPLAIADKRRRAHDESAEVLEIMGDVRGKTCLITDDFTLSGKTLTSAADRLIERGATRVLAAVTHGVFNSEAVAHLEASKIEELYCTDTVEPDPGIRSSKIMHIGVAPLIAEAIRRIHTCESIRGLFDN
jgi:ribose-phosphate pyrophosphokinase